MYYRLLTYIVLLLPAHAGAQTLRLGCGNSLPPYVIEQNNRGIALELMRRAMETQGYELTYHYGSNRQLAEEFSQGELDVLCVSSPELSSSAYFSAEPLMILQNEAVSLQSSNIRLTDISQLSQYRLGSFILATKLLPYPFAEAARQSPHYHEYLDQQQQVADLYAGTLQVIIIDRMIFRYYMSRLRRSSPQDQRLKAALAFQSLFPSNPFNAAFHQPEIRDSFDRGIRQLRDSGEYGRIVQSYSRMLDDYLFQ